MAGTSDTPDGTPAGPDDINSRLAEIAAELASEARFKEPSAAERARARVTSVGPAAKQVRRRFGRRRAQRKAEELRRPVDSPDAPAPPRQRPQSRWARRAAARPVADRGYADATMPSVLRSVITFVIVLALLVGVSVGLRYLFRHYGAAAPSTTPTPTLSAGSSASATTTANPLHSFNPAAPFAGTKAARFADGAAGIVPPPAAKIGRFTAAEVGVAYATTRKLLIDGYLDQRVLYRAPPTAFGALLDTSEQAQFLRDLNRTGVSATGRQLSTRDWVNSFVAGTVLVGTIIKVRGTMKATTAKTAGRTVLRVRTDYLFVYPVQVFGDPSSGVRVVNRVVMTVDFGPFNEPASSALVAHVYSITGGPTGVECGSYDGYVHPAFPGVAGPSAKPTGAPIDPYDQSTPPTTSACVPTTGT